MEKWEAICKALELLDEPELVKCYNEYAEPNHYEIVYDMQMFDELYSMEGKTPFDVAKDLEDVDEYDWFVYCHDVYGWRSFKFPRDKYSPIDFTDLTNYVIEHNDDLGNSSLREILDLSIVDECLDDYEEMDEFITINGEEKTVKEWRTSRLYLTELVDEVIERYNSIEFVLL